MIGVLVPRAIIEELLSSGIPSYIHEYLRGLLEQKPVCIGCYRGPEELEEYRELAFANGYPSATEACLNEEGTLNTSNMHFMCSDCYIKAGMPSSPYGWKAP